MGGSYLSEITKRNLGMVGSKLWLGVKYMHDFTHTCSTVSSDRNRVLVFFVFRQRVASFSPTKQQFVRQSTFLQSVPSPSRKMPAQALQFSVPHMTMGEQLVAAELHVRNMWEPTVDTYSTCVCVS